MRNSKVKAIRKKVNQACDDRGIKDLKFRKQAAKKALKMVKYGS